MNATVARRTATKAELRAEIKQLRIVGQQMANLCFNLGQSVRQSDLGRMVSGNNLVIMYTLSQQWDAVKRTEPAIRRPADV